MKAPNRSIRPDFSRVTPNDLALLMGVDRRTVTRWCGQGVPRNDDGSFNSAAVIRWRLARAEARGQDDQRQRLAAAQALRIERANEIEAGQLLRAEDCIEIWSTILSDARSALLSLGHRLAPLLANRAAPACCRIVDAEIRVILTDLSERRSSDGLSDLPNR